MLTSIYDVYFYSNVFVLYLQAGFFKSKYKEMMNDEDAGEAGDPVIDGGEPAPE